MAFSWTAAAHPCRGSTGGWGDSLWPCPEGCAPRAAVPSPRATCEALPRSQPASSCPRPVVPPADNFGATQGPRQLGGASRQHCPLSLLPGPPGPQAKPFSQPGLTQLEMPPYRPKLESLGKQPSPHFWPSLPRKLQPRCRPESRLARRPVCVYGMSLCYELPPQATRTRARTTIRNRGLRNSGL